MRPCFLNIDRMRPKLFGWRPTGRHFECTSANVRNCLII